MENNSTKCVFCDIECDVNKGYAATCGRFVAGQAAQFSNFNFICCACFDYHIGKHLLLDTCNSNTAVCNLCKAPEEQISFFLMEIDRESPPEKIRGSLFCQDCWLSLGGRVFQFIFRDANL